MLSTHRPHIIRMRFQSQKYFQLNSRATALLKKTNTSQHVKFFHSLIFCLKSVSGQIFGKLSMQNAKKHFTQGKIYTMSEHFNSYKTKKKIEKLRNWKF